MGAPQLEENLLFREHLAMSWAVFDDHRREAELLASGRERPEMMVNSLQCAGQLPEQGSICPSKVPVPRFWSFALDTKMLSVTCMCCSVSQFVGIFVFFNGTLGWEILNFNIIEIIRVFFVWTVLFASDLRKCPVLKIYSPIECFKFFWFCFFTFVFNQPKTDFCLWLRVQN